MYSVQCVKQDTGYYRTTCYIGGDPHSVMSEKGQISPDPFSHPQASNWFFFIVERVQESVDRDIGDDQTWPWEKDSTYCHLSLTSREKNLIDP